MFKVIATKSYGIIPCGVESVNSNGDGGNITRMLFYAEKYRLWKFMATGRPVTNLSALHITLNWIQSIKSFSMEIRFHSCSKTEVATNIVDRD